MRLLATTMIFLLSSIPVALAQQTLKVYDISQKQLRLMQKEQNRDSIYRNKVLINSLYTPYAKFWNGYLGDAKEVAKWLDGAMVNLPKWKAKNRDIDGKKLLIQLRKIAKEMTVLTGYQPKGDWYIVYGPAWTDLGGLGDFAMLVDLAHENNNSNDKIASMFPHEVTHQIMTNINKVKDTVALASIIGEGFAVWMNQKYWKDKYSLAQNLGYSQAELVACDIYLEKLKVFFEKNKYATDKEMIDVFRNRGIKLNEKLPGAIGYYLGYRLVESYVKKNGADSWKDIFIKSPDEIYQASGFSEKGK